jgi:hypothetical protein
MTDIDSRIEAAKLEVRSEFEHRSAVEVLRKEHQLGL